MSKAPGSDKKPSDKKPIEPAARPSAPSAPTSAADGPEEVLELVAAEYTDGQIVSFVTTEIARTMNGLAHDSRYLLRDRQGGIVTAFADPVNAGRQMAAAADVAVVSTPITYMFDKSTRPLGEVENQIRLLLAPAVADDALLIQASANPLHSISGLVTPADTAATLRPKLQNRLTLLQSAHRDVFDEVMPAMDQDNDRTRILFPYNTQAGGHWVTGEINITRTLVGPNNYQYTVDMAAHDPLGGGSIEPRDRQALANVITKRIAEEHNARFPAAQVAPGNFRVTSTISTQAARQHDSVSCGIISSDEMLHRLRNQAIPNTQYEPGAAELRIQQIDIMRNRHGEGSETYTSFMREYTAATEAAKAEKSGVGEASGMHLSGDELSEALLAQRLHDDFINSLASRPAVSAPAPKKPDGATPALTAPASTLPASASPASPASPAQQTGAQSSPSIGSAPTAPASSTAKPLHQRKSADIFTTDPKAMDDYIVHDKKKGYMHRGDPTMEPFEKREACVNNAVANAETWRGQLAQIRDVTARALAEGAANKPGTRGQPENHEDAPVRPIHLAASLLHNRVVAEPDKSDRGWDFVEESAAARKKVVYGATTVNVSVVQLSPKAKPVLIVAENGEESAMTPFRRGGVELAGGRCINVGGMEIGPWELPGRYKSRDPRETFPHRQRIPVLSNMSSQGKDSRHAEANTIAFLFSTADAQIREEQLASGAISSRDTAINPQAVKDRVRGMLLDTATDKCHCAECTMAMKAVFGERFNSGTPTEDRLFDKWREPFPGFYELYPEVYGKEGKNAYRGMDNKIKKGYKKGLLPEAEGIPTFNVNNITTPSALSSPSRFYEEDELETAMRASEGASSSAKKAWEVPVTTVGEETSTSTKAKATPSAPNSGGPAPPAKPKWNVPVEVIGEEVRPSAKAKGTPDTPGLGEAPKAKPMDTAARAPTAPIAPTPTYPASGDMLVDGGQAASITPKQPVPLTSPSQPSPTARPPLPPTPGAPTQSTVMQSSGMPSPPVHLTPPPPASTLSSTGQLPPTPRSDNPPSLSSLARSGPTAEAAQPSTGSHTSGTAVPPPPIASADPKPKASAAHVVIVPARNKNLKRKTVEPEAGEGNVSGSKSIALGKDKSDKSTTKDNRVTITPDDSVDLSSAIELLRASGVRIDGSALSAANNSSLPRGQGRTDSSPAKK